MLSSLKRKIAKVFVRIKHIVLFDESQIVYNGRTYRSYWDECYGDIHLSFFHGMVVNRKVRRAFIKDGFRPDEFFLYGLENKDRVERDAYLSRKYKDQVLISYYGKSYRSILGLLKDKYVFYSFLKDYFRREVTYVKSQNDRLTFLSFFNRHKSAFAKLNKGNCGIGAKVLSFDDKEQANAIFDDLISSGEWIVEELIKQDPAISQFNSSSINTIRFPSFKKNGVVQCVFPCMRFGRAGSIVDNAGQGGVFVSVDQKTGMIITDAFDEKGNTFVFHPDSRVSFRGFCIPKWEDLIELIKKAHLALPDDQVYVAFDCALSEKGWCVVEGNWGDWILEQASLKKGLKDEFVTLLYGDD